jgi:signal transduction histidine kinase
MAVRRSPESAPGTTRRAGAGDALVDLGGSRTGTVDSDRERLAYIVHDGLTQVVTATVLELDWLARQAELKPERAIDALHAAADELRKALEEIRGVLATLTPLEPDETHSIEDLLRGVVERWQLPTTWSIEGDLGSVPAGILEVASSVIRESVANVAKHADSGDVEVRVIASPRSVEVRIEDHGKGFADARSTAGHLGLEMMRRRVAEVHGSLDVRSAPGKGTRVVARLPIKRRRAAS